MPTEIHVPIVRAGPNVQALPDRQASYAFEQLAVPAASTPFSETVYAPAGSGPPTRAEARLETAQIRFTKDGVTVPSATVGTLLEIGELLIIEGTADIKKIRFFRTGGVSGLLNVHYLQ